MNRRKRPLWLLVICLLSLAGLIYLVFSYPPSYQLPLPLKSLTKWGITAYKLPITTIFFLLFFILLLSLITYLLRSPRRAALIGFLTIIYLVFQMLRLNSPYFLLLLIAFFISLELFFKKRI